MDSLLNRLERKLDAQNLNMEVQNSLLAEVRDLLKEEIGLMIERRERSEK